MLLPRYAKHGPTEVLIYTFLSSYKSVDSYLSLLLQKCWSKKYMRLTEMLIDTVLFSLDCRVGYRWCREVPHSYTQLLSKCPGCIFGVQRKRSFITTRSRKMDSRHRTLCSRWSVPNCFYVVHERSQGVLWNLQSLFGSKYSNSASFLTHFQIFTNQICPPRI